PLRTKKALPFDVVHARQKGQAMYRKQRMRFGKPMILHQKLADASGNMAPCPRVCGTLAVSVTNTS
ncbi:hypothetical protein LZB68_09670, partial [Campylobacter lari]|nr:hypothetical protein [Campylobacter lari]